MAEVITGAFAARRGTAFLFVLALLGASRIGSAESRVSIAAVTAADLSAWETRLQQLVRDGSLNLRRNEHDTLLAQRRHQRFEQLHQGVPVFGAEVVIQDDGMGSAVSIFGDLYEGISLDVRPGVDRARALGHLADLGATPFDDAAAPELVVLPRGEGRFALAYRARVLREGDLRMLFLDAQDGQLILEYTDLKTQAVGVGTGLLGDRKKVSTTETETGFLALDGLRPTPVRTFDMRGDTRKFLGWLSGSAVITQADIAMDADNVWGDGEVVDAHVHAGYLLDYLYKRFAYQVLGGLVNLTHLVRQEDRDRVPRYLYCYAAYWGNGIVAIGEGLPPGWTIRAWSLPIDQECGNLAAALDVVAHEHAHGVMQFSSNLIYAGESGALNEAFCDIVATGAEFFFQEVGSGPMKADYLFAEDAVTPGGARSLANPTAYGDPDHYTARYQGQHDNGGIHTNSNIASHAFYLAVEGGTNRTSGLLVEGVGAGNRSQIEAAFFRAFVYMLPADARFALARAATLQSARDLYGAGSAAERAVAQAWTAVGVH